MSRESDAWHFKVNKGDFVVCVPNQTSKTADARVGYVLPFSIGNVVQVQEGGVVVSWLYAEFIDSTWNAWENRAINPSQRQGSRRALDSLDWGMLLRDRLGPITIAFTKSKYLTKAAVTRLRGHPMLATLSDSEWGGFFRMKL